MKCDNNSIFPYDLKQDAHIYQLASDVNQVVSLHNSTSYICWYIMLLLLWDEESNRFILPSLITQSEFSIVTYLIKPSIQFNSSLFCLFYMHIFTRRTSCRHVNNSNFKTTINYHIIFFLHLRLPDFIFIIFQWIVTFFKKKITQFFNKALIRLNWF